MLVDEVLPDLVLLRQGQPFAELAIAEALPGKYLPKYDDAFLCRFLVCVTSVGLKLRLPGFHPLGCTAEELALHLMIERALVFLDMEGEEGDFGDWETYAFEDTDFEWLYQPAQDGIEDSPAGSMLGIGHLHYDEWFLPFNPPRLMHPYADQGEVAPWQADHEHYAPEDDEVEDTDDAGETDDGEALS
jgi:hypothetical protein